VQVHVLYPLVQQIPHLQQRTAWARSNAPPVACQFAGA